MRIKLIILLASLCSLGAFAETVSVIQPEQIYSIYGRQMNRTDFEEYTALLCYYRAEGASAMTLLIEPQGGNDQPVTCTVDADQWNAATDSETLGCFYIAPDNSFKIVIVTIDDEDAVITLMPKGKPWVSYVFDRTPLQQ